MGHKGARTDLTQARVRELFDYNPLTGVLTWRDGKGRRRKRLPGTRYRVRIDGFPYYSYRIIWLWMTGAWPPYEIDHIDGDPSNDRWDNLRLATSSENLFNIENFSHNSTGVKGVIWDTSRNKWRAEIKTRRKRLYLGRFSTKEEAAAAYDKASKILHGTFSAQRA